MEHWWLWRTSILAKATETNTTNAVDAVLTITFESKAHISVKFIFAEQSLPDFIPAISYSRLLRWKLKARPIPTELRCSQSREERLLWWKWPLICQSSSCTRWKKQFEHLWRRRWASVQSETFKARTGNGIQFFLAENRVIISGRVELRCELGLQQPISIWTTWYEQSWLLNELVWATKGTELV